LQSHIMSLREQKQEEKQHQSPWAMCMRSTQPK
jgi:hypothetical protein